MAIQFTRNGRKSMLWAQVEAMRRGDVYVEPEHLLLGLLHGEDTGALRLLDRLNLAASQVREAVSVTLRPESAGTRVSSSQLSPVAKKIVEQARRETELTGDDYVGTDHLMLAILKAGENGIDTRDSGGPMALTLMGLTYDRAATAARQSGEERIESETLGDGQSRPAPSNSSRVSGRPGFLKGRCLISINDLSLEEVRALFELTREVKMGRVPDCARNKTLALLFEKPSLRTRATFAVGMTRLGGQHIYLGRDEVGLGNRETPEDVSRCVSRWVDAIAVRTFAHETVECLAEAASVPVINALTDREHPCQALADFYTILEHRSETAGMKFVFVGDGNNVANSLMLLAPRLGTHFVLACPPGYEPLPEVEAQARALAEECGTKFEITNDALAAADDADILYTDVWTSMGQEEESAKRLRDFSSYQINAEMIREAKEDVLVMHCLPAHRGQEITADALDGPFSVVFDQAENRLHIQQALLAAVL
ncbi:MAG TPA: ornithine carbamoyltransferase [Armatimonadaceae bacterium]|nr:ornithine carbamoyltransferase [Armatimonadaceae bacterium]